MMGNAPPLGDNEEAEFGKQKGERKSLPGSVLKR